MSRATHRVLKSIVWPALRAAAPVAFVLGCSEPKPPPGPPPGLMPVRVLVDAGAEEASVPAPSPDAASQTIAPPPLPDAAPRTIPPPGMPPRTKVGMQMPNPKEKTDLRRTPRRGPA